ncbi:hypothetical protein QFC19_008604 [Naganishia cerealis]|uniref:Uncharacterized protein n=1 Tax=Naganishia cerealis TaxID=610337 RepID=A0ACC2V0J0_9TREE|nr:hypothetical protein QFC19_008604 [Naganishia cerealis]
MELRREKERKRKADWRARKRAEAAHAEGGGGGDDPGTGLSEEGRIGEEGTMGEEQDVHRASVEESSSERCAKLRHSTEASTIIATPTPTPAQHYHHHHQQQQNVIDPQLIGQGETSYSSGSGLGSSGKVQVKVGNRYVAGYVECGERWKRSESTAEREKGMRLLMVIDSYRRRGRTCPSAGCQWFEIEQVEKLIREQQAQQQAQQQAAEQEQAGGSHSTPQSQSNDPHSHRQIQSSTANSGGTSTATEDDSLTLEALMASASRDVPLPSTLHEVMQDDAGHMLDLADDNHSQTDGEHDMSSITLNTANGLGASYASLSSLSSLIGPSGSLPQMHGMSSTAVRNASPSASSTVNTNMTRQTRQLTNWFQPILWTMIDETAEKFGFNKAATIARHLKTTVSPRLFERLGERQVRKWINNEKTGWRDTVLEKVTRQEVLAHVQAGLITVPSGNGSINVSGPSVSAFGARARGGTTAGAIPREPTKRNGSEAPNHSQHHVEDHDTLDSVDDHALADIREEDGRRKRRRLREEGTSIDQPTEDLHLPLRSDLHSGIAMDPSLLGH